MAPTLYRIILQVDNLDQAEDFYGKLLGDRGRRIPRGSRHYIDCGPVILALVDVNGENIPGLKPVPLPDYIYFAVSDVDAVHAHGAARVFEDRGQQVRDDLVAVCGDPDPLPGCQESGDHVGSRVRLPGAGRALDGERVLVEQLDQPARRLELRLARLAQWRSRILSHRRRAPQQHPAGGLPRPVSVDAVLGDPFAQPQERRPLVDVADDVERDEGLRVRWGGVGRPRDVKRRCRLVDPDQLTADLPLPPLGGRLLAVQARVVELRQRADVVVLWREAIAPPLPGVARPRGWQIWPADRADIAVILVAALLGGFIAQRLSRDRAARAAAASSRSGRPGAPQSARECSSEPSANCLTLMRLVIVRFLTVISGHAGPRRMPSA